MSKPTANTTFATAPVPNPNVEPSAGEKAAGWAPGAQPPAEWLNWWMNAVGLWNAWLDAFESTAHTWTALQDFSAGATAEFPGDATAAFFGTTTGAFSAGVLGVNAGVNGRGVRGVGDNATGGVGVSGGSANGIGVSGISTNNIGVYGSGAAIGVSGEAGGTGIGVNAKATAATAIGAYATNTYDGTSTPFAAAWAVGASTGTATHKTGPGSKAVGGSASGTATDTGGSGYVGTGGDSPTTGGIGVKGTGGAGTGTGTGGAGARFHGGAGAGGSPKGAAVEIEDGDAIHFDGATTAAASDAVPANSLVKGLVPKAAFRVQTSTDTVMSGSKNIASAVASATYVTVTLATAMKDTNYIVIPFFNSPAGGQPLEATPTTLCNVLILSTTQFACYPLNTINPHTLAGIELNGVVFGDQ